MGTAEGENEKEEIFKANMIENFPKLMSDTKPHIKKAQKTPSRINAKNKNKNKKQHLGLSY